jgi:hypothetical protein
MACLAPHIESLTVPVKLFPLAANATPAAKSATSSTLRSQSIFLVRALIQFSFVGCVVSMQTVARTSSASIFSTKDALLRQRLQELRGKNAGAHWRVSPLIMPGTMGEGPGKV